MRIVRMTDEMWRTMLETHLRQRSMSERQMNDAAVYLDKMEDSSYYDQNSERAFELKLWHEGRLRKAKLKLERTEEVLAALESASYEDD